MSTNDDTFSYRLREERGRLNYSQAKIAEICGVRREVWGRYEIGKTVPGVDVLLKFTEAGADALYLMTGSRSGYEHKTSHIESEQHRGEISELVEVFANTTDDGRQALLSVAKALKTIKNV